MKIINAFRDRATGRLVRPGDPLPELSAEQREHLVRAGCLENAPAVRNDDPAPQPQATEDSPKTPPRAKRKAGSGGKKYR